MPAKSIRYLSEDGEFGFILAVCGGSIVWVDLPGRCVGNLAGDSILCSLVFLIML